MSIIVNKEANSALQNAYYSKKDLQTLIPMKGDLKVIEKVKEITKLKYYLLDNLPNENEVNAYKSIDYLRTSKDVEFLEDKFVETYERTIQALVVNLIRSEGMVHVMALARSITVGGAFATALVTSILGASVFSSVTSLSGWPLAIAGGGIGLAVGEMAIHLDLLAQAKREIQIIETYGIKGYNERLQREGNYKKLFGEQPFVLPTEFGEKTANEFKDGSFAHLLESPDSYVCQQKPRTSSFNNFWTETSKIDELTGNYTKLKTWW